MKQTWADHFWDAVGSTVSVVVGVLLVVAVVMLVLALVESPVVAWFFAGLVAVLFGIPALYATWRMRR